MAEKEKYTKYELARMRGSRALQISAGAPFLVKLSEEQLAELGYDPQRIAQLELDKGVSIAIFTPTSTSVWPILTLAEPSAFAEIPVSTLTGRYCVSFLPSYLTPLLKALSK